MRCPHIDDHVRLVQDIPELFLFRGEIGVVRSTWFAPTVAYEVEFHKVGLPYETRALLLEEQLTLDDEGGATSEAEFHLAIPHAG